jgi:hypothetical protein
MRIPTVADGPFEGRVIEAALAASDDDHGVIRCGFGAQNAWRRLHHGCLSPLACSAITLQ